ncbi:MAG: hypothetical protein ACREC6_10705 [Hyphomicrobiaceae bacterium]
MEEKEPAWALDELRRSLQAPALPADVQRSLFPSLVCVADELALDFDDWRRIATARHKFTTDRLSALASVDALLSQTSGRKNAELWTDAALADHPCWQDVRERARQTLRAFGWKVEMPPKNRATYIRGGNPE